MTPRLAGRAVASVLLIPIFALLVTSCATPFLPGQERTPDAKPGEPVSSTISSGAEARDVAQAMSLEVLAQLQPDLLDTVEQRPHGAFLSCTDEDYVWSGVTNGRTQSDFTAERALHRLQECAEQSDGRSAVLSQGSDGSPRIVVTSEDEGTYNVDPDGRGVTLVACSPCVSLAPDESVFDEY